MRRTSLLLFVFFAVSASLVAQTHNSANGKDGKNVKIGGTATFGYWTTYGDFDIYGDSIKLHQALPDGSTAGGGTCIPGADCTLTWHLLDASGFCRYCSNVYSAGFAGGKYADWLKPNLTFTATGFYPGGQTLKMHVNVKGTITGYQLINCSVDVYYGCLLGPALFTVRVLGHGSAEVSMLQRESGTPQVIGANVAFTGVAHVDTTQKFLFE